MALAFLITSENLQLLSERKVLKEAEYAALLDAAAVIESARSEAVRIRSEAQREAEERRQHGYREGWARAHADHAAAQVSTAAEAERQLGAMRRTMAEIVMKAVQQIAGELDPDIILEVALQRVEALVRAEPFITIQIPLGREQAVRSLLDRLAETQEWPRRANVVVEPGLEPDACRIQTPSGTMEVGLQAQLEAFARRLRAG
ncbi:MULTISPECIES: type III secretion system stator protein SctL [Cupriavidus]|uniref:SctL: non flagellar T3S system conserved protein n=2 Tax=Cupriavidus taiwanensis TaxID=164546 RepID=B3RAD0_CUPTR|nr:MULTISPECIES: type III secretion system stator protein SctL [Cupriavidus]MEC3766937.1 type III secretion system stator protein SctL [Cupriavidus sp. SS-3]CAQ71855.1 SctL: non flagellar T3S system conserved protein [Cupriavidus taiwanensis LMG 19424]SOY59663.1 SctL: non flagellar T3S system conserved protein [Cupriavidus taiwanensis]SOY92590.1 SctL: non flagellar T3S system conserved protein [Cupriavidus taiwanensis]SOY98230.1 SctL: non flagellar T3S system conserved protein [Cupriavidus tai